MKRRQQKPAANDKFLTVLETAAELKISDRSVRDLIANGEIKATRLSKRIIRIPRAEIDRLVGIAG